jgi:hypothetical protein
MAWRIVVVQKPGTGRLFVRPFEAVSDELHLEGIAVISLIVKRRFPRITALTQSTVSLVCAIGGRPACGSSLMDVQPFLNWKYHSDVLDRLNAVSPNACFSISYVSVAVLPCFWQNLMQTLCSFNTSISQYDGGTNVIAL